MTDNKEKTAIELFYKGCQTSDVILVSFLIDNNLFQPTHEILNNGAQSAYERVFVDVLGYLYDIHPEPFDFPTDEKKTEYLLTRACFHGIKSIEARHQVTKKEQRERMIHEACRGGQTELLKIMLNKYIKMGDSYDIIFLFHMAYMQKHYETAKALFKYLDKKQMIEFFFDTNI